MSSIDAERKGKNVAQPFRNRQASQRIASKDSRKDALRKASAGTEHSRFGSQSSEEFYDAVSTPRIRQNPETSSSSPYSHMDIRPISVPVDDAFEFTQYGLPQDNDNTSPGKSKSPMLSGGGGILSPSKRSKSIKSPRFVHNEPGFDEDGEPYELESQRIRSSHLHRERSTKPHIKFGEPNVSSPKVLEDKSFAEVSFDEADDSHQALASYSHSDDNNHSSNAPHHDGGGTDKLSRNETVMKRHRWGTQRHKNRPPKRSRSIFRKRQSLGFGNHGDDDDGHGSPFGDDNSSDPNLAGSSNGQDPNHGQRKIFVNMPLPDDLLDPATGRPLTTFPRNKIRTTKYTPLSFVPKNIYFQFHNVANIYFLLIVILGAFPIFGVQDAGLAAVPIIVIVVITAIKDAIEDSRRTILDLEVNNTPTHVLRNFDNPNVADEHVSLWRRFKKANSRFIIRIYHYFQNKKAKKSKETTESQVPNPRESQLMSIDIRRSTENPFDEDQDVGERNPAHVIDRARRTPGTAKFVRDHWKGVRVGDIVRIHNNDEIPADIVILSTSDVDGACYVETKNLDGETNLKVRQALKCGEGIRRALDCEKARFWIESEPPKPNLYTYQGVAKWDKRSLKETNPSENPFDGDEDSIVQEPININNMLLRGCSLRNTKWAIGVVVFTGGETKIMLNAGETPSKRSKITRELNNSVIANFVLLFVLCFVSGLVNGIMFNKSGTSIDYFEYGMIGGTPAVNGIVTFIAALILYQALVPISLYISIEIVKTIQAFFIYSDCFMYYEPIDYPCTPKSWNISDDLGQIEYIFSDKTGTLTQNVMEFKKCTVNGMAYGRAYTEALAGLRKREGVDVEREAIEMKAEIEKDKARMVAGLRSLHDNAQMIDDKLTFVSSQYVADLQGQSGSEQQQNVRHFMLALALCHSVISEPSKDDKNLIEYKAQSPDEAALVATARDLGFTFTGRTQRGVLLNVQGVEEEYQILNTLEFNSTRKRMSAIIKFKANQTENGREKILLICKGADSVIYSRLKPNEQEKLRKETALHLEQFANEGLRTLCIAERELTVDEYTDWNRRHEVAAAALTNREERMEEVADSIERDLRLIGGTAIEDRLQDGVPNSIELLGKAGIKLWVLTGDKVETAINIGFSCNLLDNSMELLVLRVEDNSRASVKAMLDDYLEKYFNMRGDLEELEAAKEDHSPPSPNFAVVVDGDTLKLCLEGDLRIKFLLLCKQVKSVLCCRVSPAQKAAVVNLVKNTLNVMTLSIGDGANDVAMIQEANVGVGIAGEEGRQAVMSSDYAIGQFRFLTRLVLVHGRWSYRRIAEMIPNFFYKNAVFTVTLFWYGIFTDFDGSYLMEYTYVMFFNLAFTSLTIIFMGVLDQDVSDKISLIVPQLYQRGILKLDWNQKKFWSYMVDGIYQSAVAFFFPYFVYYTGSFQSKNGQALDHRFWLGVITCTISVFSCNLYILMNQYRWDWLTLLINVISSLLVFFWTGVYSSSTFSAELYRAASQLYGSLMFWSLTLLSITACLAPRFSMIAYRSIFKPDDVDVIREQWLLGDFDEEVAKSDDGEKGKDTSASDNSLSDNSGTLSSGTKVPSDADQYYARRSSGVGRRVSLKDWAAGNARRLSAMSPTFGKSRNDNREDDIVQLTTLAPVDTVGSDRPIRFGNSFIPTEQLDFDNSNAELMQDASMHDLRYFRRQSEDRDGVRKSLDEMRRSLRMEQAPPRASLDQVRTSIDLSDMTTADNLLRVMSNTSRGGDKH